MTPGYAYYNVAAQQQAFGLHPQYAWAQAGQIPAYGQHPGVNAWAQVSSPVGIGHQAYIDPWAAAKHGQALQNPAESDPVDAFLQELGIRPEEDVHFAWIAEYGLQSDVMPPRWTMHTDVSTGSVYYVDADSGTSSWENPLTECLKVIVDLGRRYLQAPTDNFFDEQKEALWEDHKADLACWHGPLVDQSSGRQYYSNSSLGVSSWHDPRDETEFLFQLESQLLDALEDTLYGLGPEDLPTFGRADGVESSPWNTTPVRTETGAEVLVLDSQDPGSPHSMHSPQGSPETARPRTGKNRFSQADFDAAEHKTTFEKMIKDATRLNDLCRDSIESQQLTIHRKMAERRQRKQEAEDAIERAKRNEEAMKKALAHAEEEKRAEVARKLKKEQRRAEEELQKKLAAEEAARKDAERREEEERERERQEKEEAARKAEEERKARERARRLAEEKAREEREAQDRLRARLLDVAEGSDLEALRTAIADAVAAGLDAELEPVWRSFRHLLRAHLLEVVNSRDVKALKAAVADGESAGDMEEELRPVRTALEEELSLRKAASLKARKAKEDLANQFKDAKEAHDFGGAILAAQWRAAVREVAKPFTE